MRTQENPASPGVHLEVWGVSKSYGPFTALKEISFSVARGEMVCLLGPSGCGKTTALRIIAGLEELDSGRVFLGGADVTELPVSQRNVGIVFQSYALFPNLSVGDNVAYGLVNKRLARREIRLRVTELLDLVGLPGLESKYPAQLSGGQQQRVALARAMALSPDVLLLDEPLSALDAKVRAHLRAEIKRLQREFGVTSILVTHDQEEAMTMADRILLMDHGRIVQNATPGELYDSPATPFAAGFLGTMNFLPVERGPREDTARLGKWVMSLPERAWPDAPAALAAIRPEDVALEETAGAFAPEPNVLDARVDFMEFRGALYRLSLRLDGVAGEGVLLHADVTARQARRMGLSEGMAVRACLPLARLRVFPADHAPEAKDAA
ncbi:Sulfate/thiosulfate import ATP-binding protein CysA [Fundidesulfovibrio magnetotacticus]|uniref:Sulfate/thiosulfate import ATP-binding protein CysA n=1 Tax=Fundidesulfovibrio magnetotacticus TaxID=2730080 RepID=A0A6V8LR05_9BACT|nr:putative 2-aminoethylphosphonate ABC transporter ATP-binding protein [Fundidesulfovibrio magnetotacticus]GFK92991.1 Sulfate/thiosulfate import ATP-binding protein CysA [Fundidesulfovibrio magnetotacticus]